MSFIYLFIHLFYFISFELLLGKKWMGQDVNNTPPCLIVREEGWGRVVKSNFWINFTTHFNLLCAIFTSVHLKKIFKDGSRQRYGFRQILSTHLCYYNPVTIKDERVRIASASNIVIFFTFSVLQKQQ